MQEIARFFLSKTFLRSLTTSLAQERPQLSARLISVASGFGKTNAGGGRIKPGRFGDDAYFMSASKTADVIGVADGVGGWRQYGVDPGQFSDFLCKTCARLVQSSNFNPHLPVNLLSAGYRELLENKKPILGSSTACILILNRENNTISTANIGDSGFIVVRNGKLIHRSEEQVHYFNAPYQLSSPYIRDVLRDSPESANETTFAVIDGDVILVATDGVFDNVPVSLLLDTLKQVEGEKDQIKLQMCANAIALMARSLSFDQNFMSPFAISARKSNIPHVVGGKPDDITCILATVSINNDTDIDL